jgi:hypothetical protein
LVSFFHLLHIEIKWGIQGGKYALEGGQNMRKTCANMRKIHTTLKLWSGQEPLSYHPCIFITKYNEIFDQEEMLVILSTLHTPFHIPKIFGLLRGPKFWGVQKNFPFEAHYFGIVYNMCKYAQV